MKKVIFSETQKFRQWWLWLILSTVLLIVVTALFYNDAEEGLLAKLLLSCIPLAILLLMFVMRLETTITEDKIAIYFFPFLKREWRWNDLKMAEVIDYGFIGGWGIRIWTGYGTVYNVRGSKGLHFKTAEKEYVIGTQKEQELRECISHLLK
jgi:hypothetical protein